MRPTICVRTVGRRYGVWALCGVGVLLWVSCAEPKSHSAFVCAPVPLVELEMDPAATNEYHNICYDASFVYDADTSRVLAAVRASIASLRFVASSQMIRDSQHLRSADSTVYIYRKRNALEAERFRDLNYDLFRVAFSPPPIPKRRISEGGRWIPRDFAVILEIGHSNRNPQKTFIVMKREWSYWATGHIPHTEIPFFEFPVYERFVLQSDIQWLDNLGKDLGVEYINFRDHLPFMADVYQELTRQ